jgi:hypothetical protein
MPPLFVRAGCDAGSSTDDAMKAAAEMQYACETALSVDQSPLENGLHITWNRPAVVGASLPNASNSAGPGIHPK